MREKLSYEQLDSLRALRGFCAFYVVIFHAKMLWSGGTAYLMKFPRVTWSPADFGLFAIDVASSAGYQMVMCFFVLSGFFIRHTQLTNRRSPMAFFANRAARIYPPYLASVLLSAAALTYVGLTHPQILTGSIGRDFNASLLASWDDLRGFSVLDAIRCALFLPLSTNSIGMNNAHWSLLPEAVFYLSVPLAFGRVRWYLLLSAASFLASTVLPLPLLVRYNCFFALGVGLYEAVTAGPQWLEAFRRAPGLVLGAVTALLFAAVIAATTLHQRQTSEALGATLAVVMISTLLCGRIDAANRITSGLRGLGTFSYSLYLFHMPVLIVCYAWLVDMTGNLVNYPHYYLLAVPIATAASYALYLVTERPSVAAFRQRPAYQLTPTRSSAFGLPEPFATAAPSLSRPMSRSSQTPTARSVP